MVIDFQTLQQLTGYKRPSDVVRCLKAQGVRVFMGKNRPFTTSEELNRALDCKAVDTNALEF